jgi:hypothetical protein
MVDIKFSVYDTTRFKIERLKSQIKKCLGAI